MKKVLSFFMNVLLLMSLQFVAINTNTQAQITSESPQLAAVGARWRRHRSHVARKRARRRKRRRRNARRRAQVATISYDSLA